MSEKFRVDGKQHSPGSILRSSGAALLVAALSGGTAIAAPITYSAPLGPEAPGATGSGSVTLVYDDAARTLAVDAMFSGLTGTTTVAHVHCCTALPFTGTVGVAVTPGTLPGFPTMVSAGSYSTTLDLADSATYTSSFVTNFGGGTVAGAEAALIAGLNAGTAYFNIHTTAFGGGEIRGFPQPVATAPEPATLLLLGLAGAAGAWRRRTRV